MISILLLAIYVLNRIFLFFISRALSRFVAVIIQNRSYGRSNKSIVEIFRENVKKHPNKIAFIFEGKEWTFQEVSDDF